MVRANFYLFSWLEFLELLSVMRSPFLFFFFFFPLRCFPCLVSFLILFYFCFFDLLLSFFSRLISFHDYFSFFTFIYPVL